MRGGERWHSERLGAEITLLRWGHWGVPVLLFPTAGGAADEVEQQGLVAACGDALDAGRIKLYSCDSLAGKAMVGRWGTAEQRLRLLNAFHSCIRHEVVPAVHADVGAPHDIVAAGASIGAFNALAIVCRFPEVFSTAVCLSGTFDLQHHYDGVFSDDWYFSSPLHFVPGLDGPPLERLRERSVILASGEGAWENIAESWRVAEVLGAQGVPNRVDSWGPEWEHDWPTWHRMLPTYLDEVTGQ